MGDAHHVRGVLLDYRYHPHVTTVTIPMDWRGGFLPGLSQFQDPDFRCECQAFQAYFVYEQTGSSALMPLPDFLAEFWLSHRQYA